MMAEIDDVIAGLCAHPPRVSPRYFYDARGSELFDAITRLPEYYPTRTEMGIFEDLREELRDEVPRGVTMVELGSGGPRKALAVLAALDAPRAFWPIDVSAAALRATVDGVAAAHPGLEVRGVVGDFTRPDGLHALEGVSPLLVFYPGSTIGNLDPGEARDFLAAIARAVSDDAQLLVGVDLVKDTRVLEAAYDDGEGVTGAFNLNLLAHLNRRFGFDFDVDAWRHRARFDPVASRIEMHLVATRAQEVHLGDRVRAFDAGDAIWTESSYKYVPDAFVSLASAAGWGLRRWWTDPREWFGVGLFDRV